MTTVNFKYENGDLLRDKVTKLEGIVRVRAEYSTGCHHYGLQQQKVLEAGGTPEWVWLDQSQLELVENGVVTYDVNPETTSGSFPSGPNQ